MLIKFLVVLDWMLWSALLVSLLYALVTLLIESRQSPKDGPVFGVFLIVAGLAFSSASGALLYWLAQTQTLTGLVIMTLVLGWPLFPLIARPLSRAAQEWRDVRSKNSSGYSLPSFIGSHAIRPKRPAHQ